MKKKLLLMAVMTLLIAPCAAWADDDPQKVDEMVVTATRSEMSKDKIGGSSVTVITAEEIEAKKLPSVADLLRSVPGLEIRSYSGLGTTTTARIRGAQAKDTLVLIDGVMLNDPSSIGRAADLANITSDNIERIEVVRGPMSALYGTSATAGVINIITKKGSEKPSVYGSIEGGSYNTWKAKVGATGKIKKFNFSLAAAQLESEGFSLADDDNDRIPHAGNTSEKDGYKNTTLSGKFGFDITPDFDINAVVRNISSEVDADVFGSGHAGDRFTPLPWGTTPDPTGLKEARENHDQLFYKLDVHNFFFDRKL
jgi:vitamin B12 transporter